MILVFNVLWISVFDNLNNVFVKEDVVLSYTLWIVLHTASPNISALKDKKRCKCCKNK